MKGIPQIMILFLSFAGHAQSNAYLVEPRLIVYSEDKNQKLFEAHTEQVYMILNATNGDFTLNTDVSTLKTGNNKLDSVLISKGPRALLFKGNISENLMLFNQQVNDEKFYNMPGQLTISNNTFDCVAQFDPAKISILGLENKINKQLIMEVKGGKVNLQQ